MGRPFNPGPATPTLLLVEGGDEERLVRALAGPAGLEVLNLQGQGQAEASVRALAQHDSWVRGQFTRIGVVLDAEEDVAVAERVARRLLATLDAPRPRPTRW